MSLAQNNNNGFEILYSYNKQEEIILAFEETSYSVDNRLINAQKK